MSHSSDRATAAARDLLRILADRIDRDLDLRLAVARYLHDMIADIKKEPPDDGES